MTLTNETCPKCHGDKHLRVSGNKWQRCDCYYEGVLRRRMGPLYELKDAFSDVLDGLIAEDITLIGHHVEWMPYVSGMVRRTPDHFRFRVISAYEVLQIFFAESRPEGSLRPETLDQDHWLIVYLEATPDIRQIGEILFHLKERRRMLRRPTWIISHRVPASLRNIYGRSPALAELVDSLPKYQLRDGAVVFMAEGRSYHGTVPVPATSEPQPADIILGPQKKSAWSYIDSPPPRSAGPSDSGDVGGGV